MQNKTIKEKEEKSKRMRSSDEAKCCIPHAQLVIGYV